MSRGGRREWIKIWVLLGGGALHVLAMKGSSRRIPLRLFFFPTYTSLQCISFSNISSGGPLMVFSTYMKWNNHEKSGRCSIPVWYSLSGPSALSFYVLPMPGSQQLHPMLPDVLQICSRFNAKQAEYVERNTFYFLISWFVPCLWRNRWSRFDKYTGIILYPIVNTEAYSPRRKIRELESCKACPWNIQSEVFPLAFKLSKFKFTHCNHINAGK